jgi:outer membrane lipoprotein-sorting protein
MPDLPASRRSTSMTAPVPRLESTPNPVITTSLRITPVGYHQASDRLKRAEFMTMFTLAPSRARLRGAAAVLLVAGVFAGALQATGLSARAAEKDLFDEIHERARVAEAGRKTIKARFTQTTVSSLLVKPAVSKGTIVGAKPAQLVMTYTSPEPKTIVMDGTRVVIRRGSAPPEQTDVSEIVKKVNHYFVNASPGDLRKSFTVQAALNRSVTPPRYELTLVPKRKQIKQGLERLELWIAYDPIVLTQIKMTFPGGDSDTITVEDVQFNVPVPPNAFDAAVAKGAKK